MDRVSWDNGETFPDPNGKSMALLDPGLDNSLGKTGKSLHQYQYLVTETLAHPVLLIFIVQ